MDNTNINKSIVATAATAYKIDGNYFIEHYANQDQDLYVEFRKVIERYCNVKDSSRIDTTWIYSKDPYNEMYD